MKPNLSRSLITTAVLASVFIASAASASTIADFGVVNQIMPAVASAITNAQAPVGTSNQIFGAAYNSHGSIYGTEIGNSGLIAGYEAVLSSGNRAGIAANMSGNSLNAGISTGLTGFGSHEFDETVLHYQAGFEQNSFSSQTAAQGSPTAGHAGFDLTIKSTRLSDHISVAPIVGADYYALGDMHEGILSAGISALDYLGGGTLLSGKIVEGYSLVNQNGIQAIMPGAITLQQNAWTSTGQVSIRHMLSIGSDIGAAFALTHTSYGLNEQSLIVTFSYALGAI